MKKLEDTLSLCSECCRHIPAVRFLRDGQIWLGKTCKFHGYSEHLVEPDGDFYLNYNYPKKQLSSYFIEVTNHCNLTCPHCYQEPDNTQVDPSIDYLLELIKSWPDNGYTISLVGAEPTTRKDLPELIQKIQELPGKPRNLVILTNGVYLSDFEYAKSFTKFKNIYWTIGLNHPDYQGPIVHKKQLQGIKNLNDLGMTIKNISYTLEDLSQMEYCLNEIHDFGISVCKQYRIRCGIDIGRYPGGPTLYMSDLVKEATKICEKYNWSTGLDNTMGNRAHYPMKINDLVVKLIQWPSVDTIDLKEIQTESIADILPGKPPSPLIHQVILRDRYINNNLPLYDTIPQEYLDNYGNYRNQ